MRPVQALCPAKYIWAMKLENLSSVYLTCSATKNRQNVEIRRIATSTTILSREGITKGLVRLCGCACWSAPLLLACNKVRFARSILCNKYYFAASYLMHQSLVTTAPSLGEQRGLWLFIHQFSAIIPTLQGQPVGKITAVSIESVMFYMFAI